MRIDVKSDSRSTWSDDSHLFPCGALTEISEITERDVLRRRPAAGE